MASTRKSNKSEPATEPKPYPAADEFEEVEDDFKAPDLSKFEPPKRGAKGEAKSAKTERSAIEELAAELAEQIGRVVVAVEENFAPQLEVALDDEHPLLDGEVKRERRSLTTKLSREEVEASGHELAETVQKLAVVESLLDILRSGLRPTEKALTSRENALSGLVLRKERVDAVLCAHVLTSDASLVQIIRLDTGVIIDTRKPKAGEGQTRLGGL